MPGTNINSQGAAPEILERVLGSMTSAHLAPRSAAPAWNQAGATAWLVITFPFDKSGAAAVSQVRVDVGQPTIGLAPDPAVRVQALRAWIASLPPVPHIPLAALDRDQIY
jgi:hypothetical protein